MMGELGHDPDDFDPVEDDAPTTPPRRASKPKPAPRCPIPHGAIAPPYPGLEHDPSCWSAGCVPDCPLLTQWRHDLDASKAPMILKLRAHSFYAARLEVRHDPQTERWTVVLVSRTTKEDVVVAWKQTEQDAAEWARNYGVRS